jgi:predicted ATPase
VAAISTELIGRASERAQLASLLDEARNATSGVLVLEGEPGIGKTALLEDTVARAVGFRVLRAQGLQSEVELPFGALGQLLQPLQGHLASLSAEQCKALRTVFETTGLPTDMADEHAAISDRFSVAAAALALLATGAEAGPVLAVIATFTGSTNRASKRLVFRSSSSGRGNRANSVLSVFFAVRLDFGQHRAHGPGSTRSPRRA